MHIAIAGPISTADIAPYLHPPAHPLPRGYEGAPLMAVLIGELLSAGHRVSAFTLSGDLPLREGHKVTASGPQLQLHYLPLRPKAWPFNGRRPGRIVDLYAFERRGLLRAIRQAAPDVVHAHWAYEFAWAAVRSGLPHVVTSHDSPFEVARFHRGLVLSGYRWLRAGMAWWTLRQAQRVTTVSPYMLAPVQALSRVPVQVLPNPVSSEAFARQRQPQPGRQRVLMVGNGWDARKNGDTGLRAFAWLSEREPGAELLACGHGHGPGEAAEQWWQAQGLRGRVTFRGAMPHDQVLQAMADSDLLLHPALEESFGVVLAEAMAIGLPVVAGRHSGAVPWVVGEHGLLVDARDPLALCEAMAQVLQQLRDAASPLHPQLALARTSAQARFGAPAVAAAYVREYEAALQQQATPQQALA